MDQVRKKVLKFALSSITIFAFGIFVGYQLNFGSISSIHGFLFNSIGSATYGNATYGNATYGNATYGNATYGNATSSNSHLYDNILNLQSIHLTTQNATAGGRVYVSISTSGAPLTSTVLMFKDLTTGSIFNSSLQSINDNPYIVLPENLPTATYTLIDLLLFGLNSDNTTFSKQYNASGVDNYWELSDTISVTAQESIANVKLNSIIVNKAKAKIGEKVNISISADQTLQSLKLVFKASNGDELTVYPKSLESNPYFEIPTNTKLGTYSLVSATLVSESSTVVYTSSGSTGTEKFTFNSIIEIYKEEAKEPGSSTGSTTGSSTGSTTKPNTGSTSSSISSSTAGSNTGSTTESTTEQEPKEERVFIYNNEDITLDIIDKLHKTSSGIDIKINATQNTIIDMDLFNAIKGENKNLIINYNDNQLIFNGKDIINSKTIDASIAVKSIANDVGSNISNFANEGVIVRFSDNGNLPGIATVRIKATEETNNILGDNVYVYFYNENDNKFYVIANKVKKTSDGYYEFEISHNSDYIMVNEKLDESLIGVENNTVSFQKSNGTYWLLIGIGVLVISVAIFAIIEVKKQKALENNEE